MAAKVFHRDEGVTFNIQPEVVDRFIEALRSNIEQNPYSVVVIIFHGDNPVGLRLHTESPDPIDTSQFGRDVTRVWNSYAVGKIIPVVFCRFAPTLNAALMVRKLPWVICDEWCVSCGSAEHEVKECRTARL
jgi:hypothetical protein